MHIAIILNVASVDLILVKILNVQWRNGNSLE